MPAERMMRMPSSTVRPVDSVSSFGTTITSAEERIIEGADHFFFGKLYPLGEAIGAWLAGLPPAR